MIAIRVLALGAILLASPALAEGWKVESVTGDVVSVLREDVQPLDPNDVVDEGSTVVAGPDSKVLLSRKGDSVSLDPNAMVVLQPGTAGHRATVEAKGGKVTVSGGGGDGPILVKTLMFDVNVDTAGLSVTARKDSVLLLVDSGKVEVEDPKQGAPFQVSAGDRFREPPRPNEDAEAKAKAEAAKQAPPPEAAKVDEKDDKKAKKAKRHSPLTAKILMDPAAEIKNGLDIIGESVDGDEPPEIPKIGMLKYLFGSGDLIPVLGGIALAFLGLGYLTSALLGSAGFGLFGNAGLLLIGAFLGAGFHDLAFTPETWWDYEPYPGIFSTVVAGLLALIGACFVGYYLNQKDEASPVSAAKLRVAGARSSRAIR